MAERYVALLRGINVGGKNKLPMKALGELFNGAGCRGVRTYIQSGNVVFDATAALARAVPDRIGGEIERAFGHRPPIVLRSRQEMQIVSSTNPFLLRGEDESLAYVAFLADEPTEERIRSLDPLRSAPDEFAVQGREIFLHLPGGVADSKLTNTYFDAKLATVSTARNWRTVQKLLEMMNELI